MAPLAATSIRSTVSLPVPPNRMAPSGLPSGSKLMTKPSLPPALVIARALGIGPSVTVPANRPDK